MTKRELVERARKGGQARAKKLAQERRTWIARLGGYAKHHGTQAAREILPKQEVLGV